MSIEIISQFLMLSIGFIALAALFLNVDKKRTQKRIQLELAEYEHAHEVQRRQVNK
ncbi:MAG: hypothetical protein WCF60_15915 [Anaerobacillus sp.]